MQEIKKKKQMETNDLGIAKYIAKKMIGMDDFVIGKEYYYEINDCLDNQYNVYLNFKYDKHDRKLIPGEYFHKSFEIMTYAPELKLASYFKSEKNDTQLNKNSGNCICIKQYGTNRFEIGDICYFESHETDINLVKVYFEPKEKNDSSFILFEKFKFRKYFSIPNKSEYIDANINIMENINNFMEKSDKIESSINHIKNNIAMINWLYKANQDLDKPFQEHHKKVINDFIDLVYDDIDELQKLKNK